MSVEEARQRLWNALMDFEDSFADDLDRLILEVQAEMPCSGRYAIWCNDSSAELSEPCDEQEVWYWSLHPNIKRGKDGLLPERAFRDVPLPLDRYCPSCTARMKLKETADAR